MNKIDGHTKGPWQACEIGDYGDYDGNCRVILGDDMRVAVVFAGGPCADANAALIAAAPLLPEMAEALRHLLDGRAGCRDKARAIHARYDAEVGT